MKKVLLTIAAVIAFCFSANAGGVFPGTHRVCTYDGNLKLTLYESGKMEIVVNGKLSKGTYNISDRYARKVDLYIGKTHLGTYTYFYSAGTLDWVKTDNDITMQKNGCK
jgi:hypothetical protein